MTREQILTIQNIAFDLADGTVMFLPAIGPIVTLIEDIFKVAEDNFVTPYQASSQQLAAIAAGMAAARASAIATYNAHTKDKK